MGFKGARFVVAGDADMRRVNCVPAAGTQRHTAVDRPKFLRTHYKIRPALAVFDRRATRAHATERNSISHEQARKRSVILYVIRVRQFAMSESLAIELFSLTTVTPKCRCRSD